ncbi:MAG: hypothetical protein ACYDCQ_07880 [Dehalococcoidia bacterium]
MPERRRQATGPAEAQRSPVAFTLQTAFASVPPLSRPDDLQVRIEAAMEEHADAVARPAR